MFAYFNRSEISLELIMTGEAENPFSLLETRPFSSFALLVSSSQESSGDDPHICTVKLPPRGGEKSIYRSEHQRNIEFKPSIFENI